MFGSSSTIDPKLENSVKRIESSFIGERVIGAKIFEVPAAKVVMNLQIARPSKLTILEEFILRAGVELATPPTTIELAQAFGLDSVFIETECQNLAQLNVLEEVRLPEIIPTDRGKKFYKKGTIPRPAKEEQWTALWDCQTEKIYFNGAAKDREDGNRSERYEQLPIPYNLSIT